MEDFVNLEAIWEVLSVDAFLEILKQFGGVTVCAMLSTNWVPIKPPWVKRLILIGLCYFYSYAAWMMGLIALPDLAKEACECIGECWHQHFVLFACGMASAGIGHWLHSKFIKGKRDGSTIPE